VPEFRTNFLLLIFSMLNSRLNYRLKNKRKGLGQQEPSPPHLTSKMNRPDAAAAL
jgi:hypothetical protein